MSLNLSLGLLLGSTALSSGGTPVASLFANDSQSFWLSRNNAVQAGGALYVTGCTGSTAKSNFELHEYYNGVRKTYWLGNRPTSDDHDSPSVSVLPDGRLKVCLGVHTEAAGTYYRVSKNPAPNIGGFGRNFLIPKDAASLTGNSYHSAFHLENGQTVVWRRENIDGGLNRREQGFARINTADLEGVDNPVWTVQRVFKRDTARPYALYAKWGPAANRIFIVASNGHPGEVTTACSMHGFYADFTAGAPTYWTMAGVPILSATPWNITEATLIKDQTVASDGMMWPHDVIIGPDGNPWVLFSRHPTVVTGVDGRPINAEYWFARWDGSAWINHQISSNNRTPLLLQPRYVPGLCFDKSNPRKIFLSESFGDNVPEIREYDFNEVTGAKALVRTIGAVGNGREKIRLFSPSGASPATRLVYSEVESYTDITAFEMHQWADGIAAVPDQFTGGLDAATTALIARMSVAPNAAWQSHYDWLVRRLKVGGINGTDNWSDAGGFYNFIAHDAQAARLDWKGAGSATLVGAPTFTVGSDYRGINTTTDYLSFPAPNATAGFAQNSAGAGVVYRAGTGTSALFRIGGGSPVLIDNASLRINETAAIPRSLANNRQSVNDRQFVFVNRSGAGATQYYMDGALMTTGAAASTVPDSAALVIGYQTTLPTEAVVIGGSKTAAQVVDLEYALAGFRRRVQSRPAP
jgi:BNR repeat-containing family member